MDKERQGNMLRVAVGDYEDQINVVEQERRIQRIDFKQKAEALLLRGYFQEQQDVEQPDEPVMATPWFDTTEIKHEDGKTYEVKTRLVATEQAGFGIQTKICVVGRPGRIITDHAVVRTEPGFDFEGVDVQIDGESFAQDTTVWQEAFATVDIAHSELVTAVYVLKEKTVQFTPRKPYDLLVNRTEDSVWRTLASEIWNHFSCKSIRELQPTKSKA